MAEDVTNQQELDNSTDQQDQSNQLDQSDQSDQSAIETVKIFDKKTDQSYEIPKAVQEYFGKAIANERNKADDKYKTQLQDWQLKYKENAEITSNIQEKLQALEDAELTAEERADRKMAKEQEAHETMVNDLRMEADTNFDMYKTNKMQTEMFTALSQHEINNTSDAMTLMMAKGKARFEKDESGNWKTLLTFKNDIGETIDMEPTEAAKAFLDLPENSYLLRASIRPGSGTAQQQRGVDGQKGLVYSREDMQNPKVKAEFSERLKSGEDVRVSL